MSENIRPQNIGILAIDIYFPQRYVSQVELEQYDKVATGKYVNGLGQKNMAYVGDNEDIVSMSMNAVKILMSKYSIPYSMIGRLEVGTETVIDKSKSVKSFLMSLFQEHGNTNIEGIDTINACYGGTNALFNSVQWIESSYWDGRYALVVTGDIAVYAPGPARPTGGAGVVVMLIGANAPVTMETGLRGIHMENVYDFYKPNLLSEYPVVDGKLSIDCFIRALDISYRNYKKQFERKNNGARFTVDGNADFVIFHTPFNRLVQKSFTRLIFDDFCDAHENDPVFKKYSAFEQYRSSPDSFPLDDKTMSVTKEEYETKVFPSTLLSKELGNTYCASTYAGLLSLLCTKSPSLNGKRILVFSYGSGLASSIFSFTVQNSNNQAFTTDIISARCDITNRLTQRTQTPPPIFIKALDTRENLITSKSSNPYTTQDSIDHLPQDTFYLEKIDSKSIRYYKLKSSESNSRPLIDSKII